MTYHKLDISFKFVISWFQWNKNYKINSESMPLFLFYNSIVTFWKKKKYFLTCEQHKYYPDVAVKISCKITEKWLVIWEQQNDRKTSNKEHIIISEIGKKSVSMHLNKNKTKLVESRRT